MAYKGHSIIWFAPACAIIVALKGGINILDAYLGDYIKGVADYIISWFPAFFLGAIYGKIMDICVTSCIIPVIVSLMLSFVWELFI